MSNGAQSPQGPDLKELGDRIRLVDKLIVNLLGMRIRDLALKVQEYKAEHGGDVIRLEVEKERLKFVQSLAGELGIDPGFMLTVFWPIIAETGRVQILARQAGEKKTDLSPRALKANLLALTAEIAPIYDDYYGLERFANAAYGAREQGMIDRQIAELKISVNSDTAGELAVDLGCATGRMSFYVAWRFQRVVGLDISPAMIAQAEANRRPGLTGVEFKVADIGYGIPFSNNSVSLAIMNLGTASDVSDIKSVLANTKRTLKPGGRFMLSFYNAGALLNSCWFLPWQVSLAAKIDRLNRCLEVRLKGRIFLVPATAYTRSEVQSLVENAGLRLLEISTYPTVSSILPDELFGDPRMRESVTAMDDALARLNMGAYILVAGEKPS